MRFSPSLLPVAFVAVVALVVPSMVAPALAQNPSPAASDRAVLLRGVTEIGAPGVPGGVCAFGPDAFAIVAGQSGKTGSLPVVAATRWKNARVVAFGHDGYLSAFQHEGTGMLLCNAIRWCVGEDKPRAKIAVIKNAGLAAFLKSAGIAAEAVEDQAWATRLSGFDGVCVNAHKLTDSDVKPLQEFLQRGGGLMMAATGWGWLVGKPGARLSTDFAGNKVLEPTGLIFTGGMPSRTLKNGYATGGDLALLGADAAMQAVQRHAAGQAPLTRPQLGQASATLTDAIRALPPGNNTLLGPLAALDTPAFSDFPCPQKPLATDNAISRLVVARQLERLRILPPEEVQAHPMADTFPGSVPASAPRFPDRVVSIDTSVPGWHGTGLYAAPGELIRMTVPLAMVEKGYAIRIGCHADSLWHLEKWQRAPEISRREPIKAAQFTAANAFGGLIYIEVPEKAAAAKLTATIGGGVESPRFILGKTSLAEWQNKLRQAPAPWAELETRKLILSVPAEKIRQLDDPESLMKFWDLVLDTDADLLGLPHERKRPERIVPDVQISAGYMHSGYPIMTQMDRSVDATLSLAEMKAGSWGHFHELGHNHQQPEWTFEGTVEVTCNLFSLYCMETLCGKSPGEGHDAMRPDAVEKRLRGYLGMTDKFARWKSDPFLALTMYHQLRVGFGWETYKKVFAEYRDLPGEQKPRTDDEKRDQWMVRFSRGAGRNLGPFFEAWGVPTSQVARESIKDLPTWMPEDWPREK